jgi:hypothetical protein
MGSVSVTVSLPLFSSVTTSNFLFLFQIVSIVVIILACTGYSVLTPINMMQTQKGQEEANEGDEVLLEGITCTYFFTV